MTGHLKELFVSPWNTILVLCISFWCFFLIPPVNNFPLNSYASVYTNNNFPLDSFAQVYVNASFNFPINITEHPAVHHLRNYIRIRTVQPNPEIGYRQAIPWLQALAHDIGLSCKVVDLGDDNLFAVIITWNGSESNLKSVLFNSHMDVVDVEPEFWTYPPFEAHKDSEGNIFGRGSSDMKSATVATLEAIRRLKSKGFQPRRTVHVTVLPDEENGGLRGMKPFVASQYFKALNVGVDVDEGGVNPLPDTLLIYYGEKSAWQFRVTAIDQEWHGATLPNTTSGQRIQLVIDRLMAFREQQLSKLLANGVTVDQLTTVNLMSTGGGIGLNTVPSKMWADFDMRIRRTDYTFQDMDAFITGIVEEAKSLNPSKYSDVKVDFLLKAEESAETVANEQNVWWSVVQRACAEMEIHCPAAFASPVSDARFVREQGLTVFGIGPFLNTPFKAHTNNEYINENEFLRGIDRYEVLIRHLSMYSDN